MRAVACALILVVAAGPVQAQITWDGGANTANWGDAFNWSGNALPAATDDVQFGTFTGGRIEIDAQGNRTIRSLLINTTEPFRLYSSNANKTLTLTSGSLTRFVVQGQTTPDQTLDVNLALGASGTWRVSGQNDLIVNGTISGTGFGLTKTGTADLVLNGANTYTGATLVNSVIDGRIVVGHLTALSNSHATVNAAGGLAFAAGLAQANLGGLSGSGAIDAGTTGLKLAPATGVSASYSGSLTSTAGVELAGPGSQTFAGGANAATSLILSAGSHAVAGGTFTLGSVSGSNLTVQGAASLEVRGGAVVSAAAADGSVLLNGTSGVRVTGTGSRLSANLQTIVGLTAGQEASLRVDSGGVVQGGSFLVTGFSGSGTLTVETGGAASGRDVFFGYNTGTVGTGTVTGAGSSLTATRDLFIGRVSEGDGRLTVSDAATVAVTRTTTLGTAGSLLTVDRAALTTGGLSSPAGVAATVSLTNPAGGVALTVGTGNGSSSFAGSIRDGAAGPGGLTKVGTGSFALSGTNTYTGGTLVSAGTLSVTGSTRGDIRVSSGAALDFRGSTALGTSAIRADAGGAVQYVNATVSGGFLRGPGTHTINGTATFTGVTSLAGTPIAQNFDAAFVNFTNGGTLTNASNRTLTWDGGTVAVSGSLVVTGVANLSAVSNAGAVTVAGGGRLNVLDAPLVSGGGARVTVNAGGRIDLTGGATLDLYGSRLTNNGTISGTTNVGYGGLAKGAGTFGIVNTSDGGVFSPGNSPGTVTTGDGTTWGPAGVYRWELLDATGAAGTGYDQWNVAGTLNVDAATTANGKFVIEVVSLSGATTEGPAANFDPTRSYTWAIASGTTVAGFDPAEFRIDTSNFDNATTGGGFAVSVFQGTVLLTFTPVPEPAAVLGVAAAGLGLAGWVRRRPRRPRAGNEVQCKFLCHNVCCLIRKQEELGIAPQFWPAEPAGPKCLTQNLPA